MGGVVGAGVCTVCVVFWERVEFLPGGLEARKARKARRPGRPGGPEGPGPGGVCVYVCWRVGGRVGVSGWACG